MFSLSSFRYFGIYWLVCLCEFVCVFICTNNKTESQLYCLHVHKTLSGVIQLGGCFSFELPFVTILVQFKRMLLASISNCINEILQSFSTQIEARATEANNTDNSIFKKKNNTQTHIHAMGRQNRARARTLSIL